MAETYSARKLTVDSIEIVRLGDRAHHTEVSICPSIGNIAYDLRVNGQPILMPPPASLPDWQRKPSQAGIPFLAPWANRLDADAYWANGKRYLLNPDAVTLLSLIHISSRMRTHFPGALHQVRSAARACR